MKYPDWIPASVAEWINRYEEALSSGNYPETVPLEFEIWRRLLTRPEMESVWDFILATVDHPESLLTNGGLTGKINRAIRYFFTSPRLSPADYKREMLEIAKMADALANKLKKFYDAASPHNPFTYRALLNSDQLAIVSKRLGKENDDDRGWWKIGNRLDYCLPQFDFQLKGLANRAKLESEDQSYKMPLPRKINDENLFRTYFIKVVGDYFFVQCADYSPTRLATFCSVALDDPDVTPDLARKLYELDDESRDMIAAQRAYLKSED
jgi:hypothetical protein